MKNWSYTITEGEHKGKTLWSGRYCAVSAFVFVLYKDDWKVLVNKRGKGTPDFQGMWNAPCGFLEADEDSRYGCSREVFEETGVVVKPFLFKPCYVETDPDFCNNGNVTIRHYAICDYYDIFASKTTTNSESRGGAHDEVDDIKWLSIKDIDNYQWAFDHNYTIKNIFDTYVSNINWKPMSDFDRDCRLSMSNFMELVDMGAIISSDGIGFFATEDKVSQIPVFGNISISQLSRLDVTHVCWYNK